MFFTGPSCLAANELLASNNKDSGPLKDIESVMDKSLQAYGDKEHLQLFANRAQYTGEISYQSDDWQKHALKYVRKDGFWRKDIEININNGPTNIESTLFEGKNYWQYSNPVTKTPDAPLAGNTEPKTIAGEMPPVAPSVKNSNQSELKIISSEKAEWLADEADREPFILLNWQNPAYQFKLIGHNNFKQIPVYAIEIKDDKNRLTTVYIDSSNFLVLAMTFQSYPLADENNQSKKILVTKEFSENRPSVGSIWPFKEIISINKEPLSITEFSTIGLADDISPNYFVPPVAQSGAGSLNSTYRPTRMSAPITVPFEYCQREIICRGKTGGIESLWFLIDTGTSDTIIERSLAAQSLLPRGNNFKISSFRGNVEAQTTKLDRLELGGLIINDVGAQIADLSSQSKQVGRSIAGIIGMDVLSNYLITIDYAKPCLIFADSYAGVRPEDASTVPFAQMTNSTGAVVNEPLLPRVKINLPGPDAQAFLMDTGAAFNHLSANIASRHLSENLESATHPIEATGLDGHPVQLGILALDPIIIGSYKVHKVKFTYPIEQTLKAKNGSGWQPAKLGSDILSKDLDVAGILGNPFFEHFLVTIDSSFHRLLLKPNPQFEVAYEIDAALNGGDTALYTKRDFRQSELAYQKALMLANTAHDLRYQALAQGRMGNLRRVMAHDLKRPEHAQMSYQYFKKANELATQGDFKDAQGRILADWSLLYSENGQLPEAQQTMQKALLLAPKDAVVNVDYAVHLFRDRLYAEAQKYIDKALFYDPGNWQALWYQVKLAEMFQDIPKQKATLHEILQRYPWSKVAESKLKTLDTTPVPSNTPAPDNIQSGN
jgi:Tfp pilus assembly protein PilF